jgi:dephospho-CoA kinase
MIVIGLTGSIGMGKSATAELFRKAGIPVFDSDAVVHKLYAGRAVLPIEAVFPGVIREGAVDRVALARIVLDDKGAMSRLESIIHPMVKAERSAFRFTHERRGSRIIVFDIPLLFEIGCEAEADVIVVVDADESVQKWRVLARPGMTQARFEAIMVKQLPSAEKRKRANFIVNTGYGIEFAEKQVLSLLRALASMANA